jgi:hypothetical protein
MTTTTFGCPSVLNARIAELSPPKSIQQIASEAGFRNAATLAAVLAGEVALPIDRTFDLARAVRCSPAQLFKLAASDWKLHKSLLPMLDALEEFKVTEGELHLLSLVRKRLAGRDLIITSPIEEWVEAFPLEAS